MRAVSYDEHLIEMAKAEFGRDHSEYAMAVLAKAQTLVSASATQPTVIINELDEAQEAECHALIKTGRSFSKILLRIQFLKGNVLHKVQGNTRQALQIFTKARDAL